MQKTTHATILAVRSLKARMLVQAENSNEIGMPACGVGPLSPYSNRFSNEDVRDMLSKDRKYIHFGRKQFAAVNCPHCRVLLDAALELDKAANI